MDSWQRRWHRGTVVAAVSSLSSLLVAAGLDDRWQAFLRRPDEPLPLQWQRGRAVGALYSVRWSEICTQKMEHADIKYLNLLSIMKAEGYGMCDSLYYVKDEGKGLHDLDLVDSNYKVDEMLRKYQSSKKLVLTVMRDKRKSSAIVLSPVKKKKQRIHMKQQTHIDLDPDEEEPLQFQT